MSGQREEERKHSSHSARSSITDVEIERQIANARSCAEAELRLARAFEEAARSIDLNEQRELRVIGPSPPDEAEFMEALGELSLDVDSSRAQALWTLVYARGQARSSQ